MTDETHADVIALPSLDIGQFKALPNLTDDQRRRCDEVLTVSRYILRGSTIRDACVLAGSSVSMIRHYLKMWRQEEQGEHTGTPPTPYILALGYTLARAMSIRALRWQTVAESGGRESNTARWMLERRVRGEYAPPVQRSQTTNKTEVAVSVTEITAQLEATREALGVSEIELEKMGEYWAKVATEAQRGNALPLPPVSINEKKNQG